MKALALALVLVSPGVEAKIPKAKPIELIPTVERVPARSGPPKWVRPLAIKWINRGRQDWASKQTKKLPLWVEAPFAIVGRILSAGLLPLTWWH